MMCLLLWACDQSQPPARTSPVLSDIDDLGFDAAATVVRSNATVVIASDGTLRRIAGGSAQQIASGGPDSALLQRPWDVAVGQDETVWLTMTEDSYGFPRVDEWDGSAWTTHTIPGVGSCDAVAARDRNDAIVACRGDAEWQLCRWDGTTWSCES